MVVSDYVSVDFEDYSEKSVKFYVYLKGKTKLFQACFYAPKSFILDNRLPHWIITQSVIKKFGYAYKIYLINPIYDFLRYNLTWDLNEILELSNQIYFDLLESKYKIYANSKFDFLKFEKNILIVKINQKIYQIKIFVSGGLNVRSSYFKCHIKEVK